MFGFRAPTLALVAWVSASSLSPAAAQPVDDAILVRVARGRALPRHLAPRRRDLLEQTARQLARHEVDAALSTWTEFAADYFSSQPREHADDIVAHVLWDAYLGDNPGMAELAESVNYFQDRALVIEDYLDELQSVVDSERKGYVPSVRRLELGPATYRHGAIPYRWERPRPTRRAVARRLIRQWDKTLVSAQEDAVVAHVALQAEARRQRQVVAEMALAAVRMFETVGRLTPSRR